MFKLEETVLGSKVYVTHVCPLIRSTTFWSALVFQVWAHAVFYVTGFGITVLLMNLLIGVLGNNFELYQDQSDMLFQRARAKMLLELQARPWRHISNWVGRIVKDRLIEYRCGRVALLVVSGCLLIALLPVLLALVVFLTILLVLCLILQLQPEGIWYAVWVALGFGGSQCQHTMEECSIFLVLRAEPPMEDLRSLRSEMKSQVQKLESLERILKVFWFGEGMPFGCGIADVIRNGFTLMGPYSHALDWSAQDRAALYTRMSWSHSEACRGPRKKIQDSTEEVKDQVQKLGPCYLCFTLNASSIAGYSRC